MATIITTDIERAAKRLDKTLVLQPGTTVNDAARALAVKLGVRLVDTAAPAVPPAAVKPVAAPAPPMPDLTVRRVPVIPQARVEPVLAGLPVDTATGHATGSVFPEPSVAAPPAMPSLPKPVERAAVGAAAHRLRQAGSKRAPNLPVGVVLGRYVRSEDVLAAANQGLKLIRVPDAPYITRAARHAADVAEVVIFEDPNFATNGGEDGFGIVLNPLESGGANTRQGPGIVRTNGIPIGGDQIAGTLT